MHPDMRVQIYRCRGTADVYPETRTGLLCSENHTFKCAKSLEKAGAGLTYFVKFSRILYDDSPAKMNCKIVKA